MLLALSLALGFTALHAGATDKPPAPTIDVVVTDRKGQAVTSLDPSEFIVTEQGIPVAVESTRFVKATGSASRTGNDTSSEHAGAIADDARVFAMFLDEYHVAAGSGADAVRDALIRFVTESLAPDDLVVVLKPLDSLLSISMTRDRARTVQAIRSFVGRRGSFAPRTAFEQEFMARSHDGVAAARRQIAISSLSALASHLGQFGSGRKTILAVTEGFVPLQRPRNTGLPDVGALIRAANRAGVSIYPLDPRGREDMPMNSADPVAGDAAHADTRLMLSSLARETAGRVITSGDVPGGLNQVLADASGYFVLTVGDKHADGGFHAIDVAVRRPDLTVVARKGYWSTASENERSVSSLFRSPSPGLAVARRASPLIRPWFGMTRAADGSTRVNFVWEPAPQIPGALRPALPPVRVELSVSQLDGTPVFHGVVMPTGGGTVAKGVETRRASFESPAGRLLVQMSIEDATSRVLDRDVRDLVVGGFPGPITLGTAEVVRVRTARDYRAAAGNPEAMPVAARQFSRRERLLIRVPVFAGIERADVSARLVTRFGSTLRSLDPTQLASPPGVYEFDVSLAALAPGDYTIEIGATNPEGEALQSLPFRVTP